MGQRRQVLSKKSPLRELVFFGDVERTEISASALSFNAVEKAQEAAAAIEAKLKEEGVEIFSIEVFEEPADLFPVSTITIIVRSPVRDELGAIGIVTGAVLIAAALVALGFIIYSTVKVLEKASEKNGFKMIIIAAMLFGGAAFLREARLFLPERG